MPQLRRGGATRATARRAYRAARRFGAECLTSLRREDGLSLTELLVGVGLMSVVLGALMAPLLFSTKTQQRTANYDFAQQDAQSGVDSMVAQIRQATQILSSGPNSVELNVTLAGTPLLVYYECDITQSGTSYRECLRVSTSQGGTLPSLSQGTVVVSNLLNGTSTAPVFSWGPDINAPYYMTATVDVPASGGQQWNSLHHAIVFSDGALMRNLNVGT